MTTTTARSAAASPATSAQADQSRSPTPRLDDIVRANPDIVDAMIARVLEMVPALAEHLDGLKRAEEALRSEYGGARGLHVRVSDLGMAEELMRQRKAVCEYGVEITHCEVARRTGVPVSTVRRWRLAARA